MAALTHCIDFISKQNPKLSALLNPLNQKQDNKNSLWKFPNKYNDECMKRNPQFIHTSTEVVDFSIP